MSRNDNKEVTDGNNNSTSTTSKMAENGCYLNGNRYPLPSLPHARGKPLTSDEIKEAYFKIRSTGVKPSARLLRDTLGRGSFRTLQRKISELDTLFSKDEITKVLKQKLPDDTIQLLSNELARHAVCLTIKEDELKINSLNAMILKLLDDHKRAEEEMASQVDSALDKISELEQVIAKYQEQNNALTQKNECLSNQISALTAQSVKDRFKYKMLDGLSSLLSIIEESSDKKKVIEELLKRKEFKKEVTEVTDK